MATLMATLKKLGTIYIPRLDTKQQTVRLYHKVTCVCEYVFHMYMEADKTSGREYKMGPKTENTRGVNADKY